MRSVLKALWNGPFYIGKLEKPISVAEVMLKFLETVWRGFVLFLAGFVLIVALLGLVGCSGPGLSDKQRMESEKIASKYTTPDRREIKDLQDRLDEAEGRADDAESRLDDIETRLGM